MDARRGPCDELCHLPIFVIDRVPALPLVRRVAQQGIAKLPEAARCARPPLAPAHAQKLTPLISAAGASPPPSPPSPPPSPARCEASTSARSAA